MDKKSFIVYDKVSGRIIRTGSTYSDITLQINTDLEDVMEGGASDTQHYIKKGKVLNKTPSSVEYVDGVLKGVPRNTLLSIDDFFHDVVEGDVKIDKNEEDSYKLILDSPEHFILEMNI